MKELTTDIEPMPVHLKTETQVRKDLTHLARLRPPKGNICWKLNLDTGKVSPAEIKDSVINAMNGSVRKRIITESGHLYITAINKKNAARKFKKMLAGFGIKAD